MIGGKYNKCIVILWEFDLEFTLSKSKKSLEIFEAMSKRPRKDEEPFEKESLLEKHIFLVDSNHPLYGKIS